MQQEIKYGAEDAIGGFVFAEQIPTDTLFFF